MQEKEVKISGVLGAMLEQMDIQQVGHLTDMFTFYMEQYQDLRVNNNAESVSSAIHDSVDKSVEESIEKSEHEVKCGKGCSFCCFQRVDISDDEATLILSYTKEIGFDINHEVLERQAKTKDINEFNDLTPKHRRCVFLDKEGDCSIYEHRPSSCRKLVVISDPALCDTVKNKDAETGKLVDIEAEVITAASLNIRESGSMAEMILKQSK
jgi:Fe-S-cluster containining protein